MAVGDYYFFYLTCVCIHPDGPSISVLMKDKSAAAFFQPSSMAPKSNGPCKRCEYFFLSWSA